MQGQPVHGDGVPARARICAALSRTAHRGPAIRLHIALEIAKALEYIHEQKIIHRDIKPENIHITSGGTVKLMDFGIAKTQDLTLTRPGFTMGTPYYMAPEQVMGRDVTYLADMYSFGILLFELLTGAKPIQAAIQSNSFFTES